MLFECLVENKAVHTDQKLAYRVACPQLKRKQVLKEQDRIYGYLSLVRVGRGGEAKKSKV